MTLKTKSPTVRTAPPRPFKVLLLYSIMSDWNADDTALSEEATSRMYRSLRAVGMDVTPIAVRRDVEGAIKNYDPREYVIFNWCEGLDGQPNSYELIPPILERYGFAYQMGKRQMEQIQAGFQEGGALCAQLDGSNPFRSSGAANSIRLRSWAIHDGILGEPFTNVTMYKRVGKSANISTTPGCIW